MRPVDPTQFYTGIVAQLYGPLRGTGAPDPAPYVRFIERYGQPALELGCGEGEPLLDLRELSLDVEGLDSSIDMVDRCRAAALRRGIDVTVHCQPMQTMQIPRIFRSIFLAGPTFNLLPDDATAFQALGRIREHLAPDGAALIPLFIPEPTPVDQLGRRRSGMLADGSTIAVSAVGQTHDEANRCQTTVLRYERHPADASPATVEDRSWLLHWYTQDGFRDLAAGAGFGSVRLRSHAGGPADPAEQSWSALLRRHRAD